MEKQEVTLQSPIETALAKENVTAQAIEDIKTKYEFKAAKYKTVQASVNDLLDKTITYAKSKI